MFPIVIHRPVKVNGIQVDMDLADTLKTFWAAGIKTWFSCQGQHNNQNLRYILFVSEDDVAKALSMIVDNEVSLEEDTADTMLYTGSKRYTIRYIGDLTLKEPGEPVEVPHPTKTYPITRLNKGVVTPTGRNYQANLILSVKDGKIVSIEETNVRFNRITSTPREIAYQHHLDYSDEYNSKAAKADREFAEWQMQISPEDPMTKRFFDIVCTEALANVDEYRNRSGEWWFDE